jgi:hypothetical protein
MGLAFDLDIMVARLAWDDQAEAFVLVRTYKKRSDSAFETFTAI